MFGHQIVETDMFGKPIIPVEYPTIGSKSSGNGATFNAGSGFEVFFKLLPFALLAGGLYSVFATMAGSLIFNIASVSILGMLLITIIADYAKFIRISNGMQQPFYIFSMGWIFGITPFWINFFYNMNFDVSNTNYLTWDAMMSKVFPQMGLCACLGITLGIFFSFLFRSDMFAVRKSSHTRYNKRCVFDMVVASFAPPVLAVIVSLVWCLIIATVVAICTDLSWDEVADKQATAMAVVFVVFEGIVAITRSYMMVKD